MLILFLMLTWTGWAQSGIAWYADWDTGLAEARRTNRPILLIAAAPHCHHVSGIW